MLPPLGTIVVGPCPECQGLVVVFCGQVLALDTSVMINGTIQQKRDHLMDVLTAFLRDRIVHVVTEDTQDSEEEQSSETPAAPEATRQSSRTQPQRKVTGTARSLPQRVPQSTPVISQEEVDAFVDMELKLLDNEDYFKAMFG